MKYAYENMSPEQFEKLIVFLCQELLGVAVQGFSKGPDGGRDAKFVGTAQLHPSTAAPWLGTTIIQAKHTNGYNKNFTESDFKSTLSEEIPKIKNLWIAKKLNHYMLFSNRRLSGNAESEIRDRIATECGIPESSLYLCGIEQLEIWLKKFPKVAILAELDPIDSPLIVSPDDLAEIVMALARQIADSGVTLDDPPTVRVTFERKNTLNNMSVDYAKAQRKRYLKETAQIRTFLAAPENDELLRMYESVVDEFQLKIITKRKNYQSFDDVMEYLVDLLFSRDPVLRQLGNKRLTRVLLFYMYWNCDIGETDDATTN